MPLKAHLVELRNRLIIAAIALVAGAVAGWFFYDPVLQLLMLPIEDVAAQDGRNAELNFAGVVSPFDLKVKVSLFIGAFVSSPMWLYQVWAFVVPGLTRREKRYTLGFLAAAIPLFLAGTGLAFFALPNAIRALTAFTPTGASNFIQADQYLSFVMLIILVFGVAFVLPVLLFGLNLMGILSARTIARHWRWIVMLVFVFAAIATPAPDALSMFFLVIPMMALFALSWVLCWLNDRRRKKRAIAEGTWVDPDDGLEDDD
ncbi:twin-arginine translocase subunit TatC [Sediminivirga luteola]|jgi:sec-independent protein translocase protein TatC|nr:twin-arginine translocase subunit TatC [Sediminivirga luteola]MCI2264054.1 twin-arginine translocase subunit TatC [Sediminivirga luteola]